MSMITVYIGHSGERLTLDPSVINNLEGLKSFVGKHGSIQPRSQILLTPQGKQVRTQTLLTENELFVFDSSRLNSKNVASPSSSSLGSSAGSDFDPGAPPESIANQSDLQAWLQLFRARRSWASGLLDGCDAKARRAEKYQDEQGVIERSLGVAMASLQQHIKSAEQKFASAENWANEFVQEQDTHVGGWEAALDSLRDIPARPDFTRFIQPANNTSSKRMSQQDNLTTLQGFVDVPAVKKAAGVANSLMQDFNKEVDSMREELGRASKDAEELLRAVDQINTNSTNSNTSEPAQLLDEIELVFKKMTSDLEHVQSLSKSPQSVSQASKMALLHTRNYVPNLGQYCVEMNEAVRRAQQQRNSAADTALEHMRTLASVESVLAELYQDVKALDVPQDDQQAFSTLSTVSRLPSVYGALLIESVRRREWVAKMKRDAGTLQEEVATYQDEEDKRRKKWVRTVEDVARVDALRSSVLGIELSLQNEGGSWPMVTREELQDYLDKLNDAYGQGPATEEMDQAIKDLDKPTRKQIKHAKAFKNGSMHEAAFGDTSLLLRGDDQYKSLREMNSRLEEELKGQKSRVRKLEDLLHRQSTIGRASSGDMFTPQSSGIDRNLSSPAPVGSYRPPSDDFASTSHGRKPSVQIMEEKKLARRVVDLEAELQAARDEATSRKSSGAQFQQQIDDATSTKKDLMQNMEAQQREFADERRNLEQELREAKERVEEVENEIERLMGSRDDERSGVEGRVLGFEREIKRLKEDVAAYAGRAATEQDARSAVERKLEAAESARADGEAQLLKMREELDRSQEAEVENAGLLMAAHAHLSPDTKSPDTVATLTTALEDLARRAVAHTKDLEESVAFAKSENQSLWSSNERQKSELGAATQKQSELEAEIRQTQEQLSLQEAKATSLEQQLSAEQEQLRTLRNKFADGETGSEVLRQRVAEEEARAGKLSASLAEANSHINSLDVELMRLQRKHDTYHQSAEPATRRLDKRAEYAKEVSQKLFAQNSRLNRLLERLGLIVTYRDDGMSVERASKMGSSTSMMVDPHSQLIRTSSLPLSPTRKSSTTDDVADLSALRWPDAQTAEQEDAQYEVFQQQMSKFNIDAVTEAILKRLRDYEYTAKKYNKEAKDSSKRAEAYKERSVKLKTEAHSKIAVKDFKEGDLALFLPTRGQAKGAWAAFNVGYPHYFLAEREGMRLANRDYIVARIGKIEQKVVDLSRTMPPQGPQGTQQAADHRGFDETTSVEPSPVINSDDDNPFDLSDGLTWWMVHATEERGAGGAPTTPGLGKSTVAAAAVDARAIRVQRTSTDNASKSLNKTLDSRRSSSTSTRKGAVGGVNADAVAVASPGSVQRPESQASVKPLPAAVGSGVGVDVGVAGLGITAPTAESNDTQPQNEQVRMLSRPESRAASASPSKSRQRSKSPSKSIRSLQRHLEPQASPAKTPTKTAPMSKSQKQGWESLWQGEFSLESPSKSGK